MDSTTSMITSITMVILFSIAIIGFSVGFANDNNSAVRIDDDANLTNLDVVSRAGMNNLGSDTEETYASIVNTTLEPGSDAVKSPGVFTITWGNLYRTFTNIITFGYAKIFGSGGTFAIFLGTFLTIIAILFTLYIIKTWRGNP